MGQREGQQHKGKNFTAPSRHTQANLEGPHLQGSRRFLVVKNGPWRLKASGKVAVVYRQPLLPNRKISMTSAKHKTKRSEGKNRNNLMTT